MAGSWDRIVGIRDLIHKAGLDPDNPDDFGRAVNWLRTRKIPFASIGKATKGRRRGILLLAEHVEAAIASKRRAD
ncbi:MAG: hypothetical protein QN163_00320 [Armatimonadota bacterium]|nr:hypothetical protein [Armatimonadota bacterium]MDR5696620.1 hypothetical protein [Armatimonadota bacterium]